MTVIVGGHETGLLDSSLGLLNRNDRTSGTEPGHGEQPFVNVSNGNVLIQHQDAFLPSLGDDYSLIRTYNSRAVPSDAHQHDDSRWSLSTTIRLDERNNGGQTYFELAYGDGSVFEYRLDTQTGLYTSVDGAGAFETLEDLGVSGTTVPAFIVTRSDQTRLSFDRQGRLLTLEDTNGVKVDYIYSSDRLVQVLDDQGHVLNYTYMNGVLFQVTDESEGVLVEYRYDSGRLSEVIDRYGHSTKYFYTNNGYLNKIVLPSEQVVDGQTETYASREINISYDFITWNGSTPIVTEIVDAMGGVTTFDYDFDLVNGNGSSNNQGNGNGNGNGLGFGPGNGNGPPGQLSGGNTFRGGVTRVVDALGNNRTFSNDQQYIEWRTENGFYAVYDVSIAENDPSYQSQVDQIRSLHALTYTYDENGAITEVIDQQGFRSTYVYDDQENLISFTDRNGWGVTNSDSDYFRNLRAELGYLDMASNGKLVSQLNPNEIEALLESFTQHFEYNERGLVTSNIDAQDNLTTFTYTTFNKPASTTSALGYALTTSNESYYQERRVELGYSADANSLSASDVQELLDLHTTYFEYDANQNLIEQRDPGGDITRFTYDSFGNQTQRIVYLDANDLVDPDKQQITTFAYDSFGNNISVTDAEGNLATSQFDHFGNLLSFTDGNGGVTQFTYDNDNRLLTITDPEGHTTVNTYDAVGNRISITDANGHTVTRLYDLNNNLLAIVDPSDFDPADDQVTQFEYDVVGNRTSTIDAEGRRTEFTFNSRRELVEILTTEVADENGNPTQYLSTLAYDGESNTVRSTNNRGFTTELTYDQNNLLLQRVDPNGHITRFEYDANLNSISIIAGIQLAAAQRQILRFTYDEENQQTSRTDAEGNQTQYAYDAPGNRIGVTDPNGNTTDFEFDGNNRLIREIRPEVIDPQTGVPVRYTVEHVFDANGNEVETIDENGNSTRFTFDLDNRLVMTEDANGIKTVFEYDSRDNRTAVLIGVDASSDANGQITISGVNEASITRFTYDEFNQLIAKTDGVGNALVESDAALYRSLRIDLGFAALVADLSTADKVALRELYTERYTYDKVGNRTSFTDNLGRVNSFQYDGLNRMVSDTDAAGGITQFGFDGNNNRTSVTDQLGRVTEFEFDSVDRVVTTTDPIGAVESRQYDDFGNVISQTRAFGTSDARTSTFIYDLNNRVVSQTDPELNTQSFEYDAVGNRVRITDGRGNDNQFIYDALNRTVKILDPLNFETVYDYDGVGNVIGLTDPNGGVTQYSFDPGNRQISVTDGEGRVVTSSYNRLGNRIEQRTAAGTPDEEITVFEYDAESNLRRVIDAEGGITESGFDQVYNQVETIDANGNRTIVEFDALNRVVRTTDAENQVTEFAYDAVNNRLSQTDALGRVTEFVYDDNNRSIRQIAADGVETEFAYDLVGSRTSVTRAANTADAATDIFVYDLDDRLISRSDAEGNTTVFTYDENDNTVVSRDANGNETLFVYDANNQVIQIQDPEGGVVQYSYDGNGNRTQVVDARGSVSTTYFNFNDEVSISVDAEGYATSFLYDNNGNVVSQTLHMQALSLPIDPQTVPELPLTPDDQTITFEYDKLNRVTARIDAEGFRTEFAYDAVGNELQITQWRDIAGTDVVTTSSFYDDVNRVIARVTAEGYLLQNQYDSVGNRIATTVYDERVSIPIVGVPTPVAGDAGRTQLFTYNLINQQTRATSALGVNTDFEYDDRGNTTAVVEAAGSADQRRTEFVFDRADRLVQQIDALGTITQFSLDANGNVVERYDAFGTSDQRITSISYDGNNRTTSQTDAVGVTTQFNYDANGNVTSVQQALGLAETRIELSEYDKNNRVIAQVNGEGDRVEFSYDGAGNQVQILEAPGLAEERITVAEFDRDNRQIAQIDGEGVRTEFVYDGADNRIEVIEAAGVIGEERRSYSTFDLDNRVIQQTDALGGIRQYDYDVLGNRIRIVDENGGELLNAFDAIGRLVSSITAGGTLTANTYDLRNNLLSRATSFSTGDDVRLTLFQYDLLDREIVATNANGYSTKTTYDVFGNAVQVTSGLYLVDSTAPEYDATLASLSLPQTTSYMYDAANQLIVLTDALGTETTFAYDGVGNRVGEFNGTNQSEVRATTYSYDLANRLVETVNPEGGVTQNIYNDLGQVVNKLVLQSDDGQGNQIWISTFFEYDDVGRLSAQIDGEGVRFEYGYDSVGNQTSVRSAVGTSDERVVQSEFDLNNRIVASIDGEGNRSEYAYDSVGNQIQIIDPRGNATYFYYDADNRNVVVVDSEGFIEESDYDSIGNKTEVRQFFTAFTGVVDSFVAPTAVTSDLDRVTTFEFDGQSQLTSRTDADGAVSTFTYDGAGNVASETDALGRVTSYVYDANNRLTIAVAPDGIETHYGYDYANNQTSVLRAANSADSSLEIFTYDLNNRLTQKIDGLGTVREGLVYDRADNVVARLDGNGNVFSVEYDLNNRITESNDGAGIVTLFEYDAVGNQIRLTDGRNGSEVSFYNDNNLLTHLVDREGYVTTFQYDQNNNVVSQTLYMQAVPLPVDTATPPVLVTSAGDQTILFQYDTLNRVVTQIDGEGFTTERSYDAAGNVVATHQYRDLAGNDIATTLTYFDNLNRAVASLSAEGYLTESRYDAVGNLVSRTLYDQLVVPPSSGVPQPLPGDIGRTESFEYDAVNQLVVETSALGVRTVTEYDDRGNRLALVEAQGTPDERRTAFEFDAADRLISQTDALGVVTQFSLDANGNTVERRDAFGTLDERLTSFSFDGNNRTTSQTDAIGVVTQYVYDANGNLTTTTFAVGLAEERTETREFDSNNRLIAEVNGEGERAEFTYDGAGNQIQIVVAPGLAEERVLQFEFNRDNQLVAELNGEGVRTEYRYDGAGNQIEIIEAAGSGSEQRTTVNVYDLDNRWIQSVNALGGVIEYSYDALNNRVTETDENGGVRTNTYDIIGRLVSSQTAGNLLLQNQYDLRNNIVSIETSFTDGSDSRVQLFTYDLLDRQTQATDANGFSTHTVFDAFGNAVEQTSGLYVIDPASPDYDPDKAAAANPQTVLMSFDAVDRTVRNVDPQGIETTFVYDAVGNLIERTDAANTAISRTTTYQFDLANRLVQTNDPVGGISINGYDDTGQLVSTSILQSDDGAGNQVWINNSFEYDDNGRISAQIDGEGVRFEFGYDAVGNEISVRSAVGSNDERLTTSEYDLNNRLVAQTDGEGNRTEYVYDSVGNKIQTIDARGNSTYYYYDSDNRNVSVLNGAGYVQEFIYDSVGNRTEVREYFEAIAGLIDPITAPVPSSSALDRITTYAYNELSQLVGRVEADGASYSFEYDGAGNLVREVDALGGERLYTYDANNRIVTVSDPRGIETHYGYDEVGNRTSIVRAANTADAVVELFSYDLNNRLIQEVNGLTVTQRQLSYDLAGNQVSETDANGNLSRFAFDLNNRFTELTDGEGFTTTYIYDDLGNIRQEVDGRGHGEIKFYDDNGQVTHLVDREGFVTTFSYDSNGNIINQTVWMQGLTLPVDSTQLPTLVPTAADQSTTFEYDELNRAVVRIDAEGYRTEFVYDAAGNQIQVVQYRDLANSVSATQTTYFDAMNREVARISAEGYLTTSQYDAEGNRTQHTQFDEVVSVPANGLPQAVVGDDGRISSYVYDASGRMVRSTSALGVSTDFEYDDRGNRTATVEASGTAIERRTEFVLDAADRVIDSIDALGVITRVVRDANGNVVERREAFGTAQERVSTYTYDANNRAVSETNAIGVVYNYAFDGNGNLLGITSAVGLPEARTETFEYDRNNLLIAETNGEGERTESTYDGAGNRVSLTIAPGLTEQRTNTFEYDRDNRLIATVDGEGVRTEYRYDGDGNKIETIQAVGVVGQERNSFYTYDLDNRLVQVIDPLSGTTTYTYDVLGNQTQIVDANGGIQTSSFDQLGRLVSTTSAGNILTTNDYDVFGNIVSTTQSFGDGSDARTTLYGYDLLDRQTLVTDPEGFSTSIQYDAFGNQITVTHGQYLPQPGDADYSATLAARASVQTNVFVYDAADRLASLTDGENNTTTYTYDAFGNQISFTEAANSDPRTTTFSFDLADRLIETITPEGGISRNTYNEAGNRITESVLQSVDGGTEIWSTTTYEYDANAQVTAQIDSYGVRTEFEYDSLGNQTLVRVAAGTVDERVSRSEYDLNNRLITETDGEGNQTSYAHDSLGNRIQVTDALGRVARFYFDGSGNLISVLDAEGYVNEFTYDSAGNRTNEIIYSNQYTGPVDSFVPPVATTSTNDRTFASVYDGNSRIVQRVLSDGSATSYEYDAAGNLLVETQFANIADASQHRVLNYVYDLNNRLVEFTDVDGTLNYFAYDGANNKISETIVNSLDPNSMRVTTMEYDLNNRLVREVFDPAGLSLVQTIEYDLAGNAIANTNANGAVTRIEFDLNNRVVRQIDALNNDTLIVYDAAGNQISLTDANGQVTTFAYDNNNRLILETLPQTDIYTIENGVQAAQLTIGHTYDAAGNETQTVDAAGNPTTYYYDSNDRLVAQLNSSNYLTEWTYGATGELLSETVYMTQLTGVTHDPLARPAAPAGDSQTKTYTYDLGGRATSITYPAVEITTLSGTDGSNPTITTNTIQPVETFSYDAYGNQIEAVDLNGNRTLTYYDIKGRIIAQIDPAGYLTEFDYDAQDNVVEQRVYTAQLDNSTIDPNVALVPPTGGEVFVTNRYYDAASRLLEEHSPMVEVFDPATLSTNQERVITRFGYDGVGNQISRTLAAGSVQEFTEFTYFDVLNRQVAVVDGNRVVSVFGYDANGNQTLAKRYFNTVAVGVDLSTLDGTTNFASLLGNNANDQQLNRIYDSLNRLSSETELMGAGSADDLIQTFGYDANGNRTQAVNEDGFVQLFSYDSMNNLERSESPDSSGTVYAYDAMGNQVFAFTGQLDSTPVPATNLGARFGDSLSVDWDLPAGANVQSYIVYDTQSRADVASYSNQTPVQGTWFETSASGTIPTSAFNAGDTVYFRVVTQDASGSFTSTTERSVTLPPRIEDIALAQVNADTFEITVQFDATTTNPSIVYGMPGSTNIPESLVDLGGGLYRATLTGITNPQELAYRVQWEDSLSAAYQSDEISFEAQGDHLGITSILSESTIVVGTETLYRANIGTTLPADFASELLGLSATWVNVNDSTISGNTSVEGVDSGLGYFDFPIVAGAGDSPLAAGTYSITLRAVGENDDIILDTFEITVGSGLLSGTERSVSWTIPDVGDSQVVIVDGQRVEAVRESNRLVSKAPFDSVGSVDYSAFYGSAFAETHTTTVGSTEIIETDNTTTPPTETSLGFDVSILTELSAAELANLSGDMRLAWRVAGSGTEFTEDLALTATGSEFDTTLALLAAGEYDLKIYYTDVNGDEVIVDWLRIDTATVSTVTTDNSVTVAASEVNGQISLSADDTLSVDSGLYSGPLPANLGELTLATQVENTNVTVVEVDGSSAGYFVDNRYDALGNLIATNAETGLWREFGVDANGNQLVTRTFGVEGAATSITTLAVFDGRNREIAQFDAEVDGQRAVLRAEYDVNDNLTLSVDALGGETRQTWSALGSLTSEQDQLSNVTTYQYDRLGRNTSETDALGNTRYKRYDVVGNLIQTIDGEGHTINYTNDVFGRQIQISNALNQTVSMTYDQRDRLVSQTDALGQVSSYEYDGRDNRTRTVDTNGNEFRQVWDSLGRIEDTITYQNGQEIHERSSYDAYGNLVAEIDGNGRIISSVYGEFGRLQQRIDSGGRITNYEYDDQGRVTREYSLNTGKDIRRSYDQAGRLLEVDDLGTGVKTVYTYDLAGRRATEVVTTPGNEHNRDVSYQYDAIGQMVRWADSVTGMHTNYMWDAAGNLAVANTDLGYDPDGEGLAAGTRFVDHVYSYNANNIVTSRTQRGAIEIQYGYDAAGNRTMVNTGGSITTYEFDDNGRVIRAQSGGETTADWQYDSVGNVTRFRSYENGSVDKTTTKQYYENNRNFFTNDDGQQTTLTLDRAGNVTRTKLVDDGDTFYFDHFYNASGLETRINARGDDVGGRTINTYNTNDQLSVFDKGKGDSQDRNEILRFTYNNEGQIIYRFNDTGIDSDIYETEFAYANSNPVGQTGATEDAASETLLDTGQYNLVKDLGDEFPGSSVSFVSVSAGDTLQGIAAAVYGNPSLWFVLAEANGLAPGEALTEGQRLQIPNTISTGTLTADTHVVYNEGDIIGSTLPNLKSDPSDSGCGGFLAIIIIAVIAVVAAVLTAGLATAVIGPALAGAGLGATATTVLSFAIAGAIVGAAASIVQQGLFIALGFQDEFSWKAVAAGAVSGALSGAATGLGEAVRAAAAVGDTIKYAKAASAALQVASVASKQLIENGKITSWTSLAAAGIGGALSTTQSRLSGLQDAAAAGAETAAVSTLRAATISADTLSTIQTAVGVITPWVQLAETAIRNDGQLTPADWVSAVGNSLSAGIGKVLDSNRNISAGLEATAAKIGANLAIGGALALYDKDAAVNFISNSVGGEIGSLIGTALTENLNEKVELRKAERRAELSAEYAKPEDDNTSALESQNLIDNIAPEAPELEAVEANSSDDITGANPNDAQETGLLSSTTNTDGEEVQDLFSTRQIAAGDSLWRIAKDQLGPDATNEQIQRQAQILMELNPSIDPANLRVGDEITIVPPFSEIGVSADTLARYQSSDADYQEYVLAEQRRAQEAAQVSQNLSEFPEFLGAADSFAFMSFAGDPEEFIGPQQFGPQPLEVNSVGFVGENIETQEQTDPLELILLSLEFGETFADGSLSGTQAQFASKEFSERDLLFGLLTQVAINTPADQFASTVQSLGLDPQEAELALSVIFGQDLDFSELGPLKTFRAFGRGALVEIDTDAGILRKNTLRVQQQFLEGELTRREVIDQLVFAPAQQRTDDQILKNRIFGGIGAVGGVFEVIGGVAISTTGLGALLGVPLAGLGVDNIQAGVRQAISGEVTKSGLQLGLEATGLSESNALIGSILINLGAGVTTGLAQAGKLGKFGQLGKVNVADDIARNLDDIVDLGTDVAASATRTVADDVSDVFLRTIDDVAKNADILAARKAFIARNTTNLSADDITKVSQAIEEVAGAGTQLTDARLSTLVSNLTTFSSKANRTVIDATELQGLTKAIKDVEGQGFRLIDSLKINGNQGIDLVFEGIEGTATAGRFAAVEAKSGTALASFSGSGANRVRQGSADFLIDRFTKAGRPDLADAVTAGRVDSFFSNADKFQKFNLSTFTSGTTSTGRTINFSSPEGQRFFSILNPPGGG